MNFIPIISLFIIDKYIYEKLSIFFIKGTCDTLSTPSGGAVSVSTDGINTRASYTCNNGYTLNGVNAITCRSDGSWDFTEPTCGKLVYQCIPLFVHYY